MMGGLRLQSLLDARRADMSALFSDYIDSLIKRIARWGRVAGPNPLRTQIA